MVGISTLAVVRRETKSWRWPAFLFAYMTTLAYLASLLVYQGGKLLGFWYAFGAHDGYNLWEAPDNVSVAAVALAIGSGGALSSIETTVLLTVEETMDALRKAQNVKYRAPGT